MIDTNKLKSIIVEKGVKNSYLAEKLGISKQSLSNKLNNKTLFSLTEVKGLCEILKISPRDCFNIFLS